MKKGGESGVSLTSDNFFTPEVRPGDVRADHGRKRQGFQTTLSLCTAERPSEQSSRRRTRVKRGGVDSNLRFTRSQQTEII
jgi:hypothetical protein